MDIAAGSVTLHASTGGRAFDPSLPTVVLVHGAGMDHTVWALQARGIAFHGYSLLSLDLPGHGRSGGPPCPTIGDYADTVATAIDSAATGPVHYVGHSMGSLIGLELAARYADRVASLSLLGTAAAMPVHPALLAAAKANDHLAVDLVSSWSLDREAHKGGHPTPGLWMLGTGIRTLERARPGVLHNDLAACAAHRDAPGNAAKITCPTLLLLGERDMMTRPKGAAALAEVIADCTTVILAGAGHSMMLEQPDRTLDTLLGFWGRL